MKKTKERAIVRYKHYKKIVIVMLILFMSYI